MQHEREIRAGCKRKTVALAQTRHWPFLRPSEAIYPDPSQGAGGQPEPWEVGQGLHGSILCPSRTGDRPHELAGSRTIRAGAFIGLHVVAPL